MKLQCFSFLSFFFSLHTHKKHNRKTNTMADDDWKPFQKEDHLSVMFTIYGCYMLLILMAYLLERKYHTRIF